MVVVPDRKIPSIEAMNRTVESGIGGGYLSVLV
jgi:hypothetical protein